MPTKRSPIRPEKPVPGAEERSESSNQPSYRFRRFERLKKRVEISGVFKKGRAFGCPGMKLFVKKNGLAHNRIVVTFARKYGNAVKRNRARRIGREAYRLMRPSLKTGYDLVMLVYPAQTPPGLALATEQLKTLFTKAGIQ